MTRLPPLANVSCNADGLIFGDDFGDSYYSRNDGLGESRAVFLGGAHLPDAWQGRSSFVIGELGFGTGLNFLATWDLWRKHRPSDGVLHYFSVEGFLLDSEKARAAHGHWPQLEELSLKLTKRWPVRSFGAQRIWFDDDNVCLTVLIGPCRDALSRMDFQADCWFLDGFSPSKNPQMWSDDVLTQIKRLSAPHARVATYSVAGAVRQGLSDQGFVVAKVPGFAFKRERLEAHLPGVCVAEIQKPKRAIVIGGGIAGCSIAAALLRRGIEVELFDGDPCGRTKASGNPLALVMPRLDRADTREARFFRAAYLMALDAYKQMGDGFFATTGVREICVGDDKRERHLSLGDDPPLPPSHLTKAADSALVHHQAGLVYPDAVLAHLRAGATRHPINVARLVYKDATWHAYDQAGTCVASADICVVANGQAAAEFSTTGRYIRGRVGQLSWAPLHGDSVDMPLSGGAYCAPFGDKLMFGATYETWDMQAPPPCVRPEGHTENNALLAALAPDVAARLVMSAASGRTSVRAATPDQLPMVGACEEGVPGKFVLCGLGSRGFTTAFLCAEMIAAGACGEPSPVERDVAIALSPDRFAKREQRRMTAKT